MKTMTLQQATKEIKTTIKEKRKLGKISKGKYHSVKYELIEYSDGELIFRCSVYIDGEKHYTGCTWEEAFKKRDAAPKIPVPHNNHEHRGNKNDTANFRTM